MAKKKTKTPLRSKKQATGRNGAGKRKKVKSPGSSAKKSAKKKPKGPSWGPKPVDPWSGRPKKKWPKKKKPKKWPPKKKTNRLPNDDPGDDHFPAYDDIAPHVGTLFSATSFDPPMPLELIEVGELDPIDVPPEVENEVRSQPFYLRFLGPPDVELSQGVYTLEHDQLATLTLLLVPVGPSESSENFQIILEAIFG